jgi:RND superfamily putative drug exporter
MTLLGKANWWLPSWLDRILPVVSVEATDPHDRDRAPADAATVPAPAIP